MKYEELIKRLQSEVCVPYTTMHTMREAADAIEELQQIAAHYEQTAKDYWKEACDYKAEIPRWIPVTSRPMTEEERQEYSQYYGYSLSDDEAVIYTSTLPADGQEVLTCDRYGAIDKDVFVNDGDGCYFEDNGEMDGIVAWMPLPKPPKEEKDAEQT